MLNRKFVLKLLRLGSSFLLFIAGRTFPENWCVRAVFWRVNGQILRVQILAQRFLNQMSHFLGTSKHRTSESLVLIEQLLGRLIDQAMLLELGSNLRGWHVVMNWIRILELGLYVRIRRDYFLRRHKFVLSRMILICKILRSYLVLLAPFIFCLPVCWLVLLSLQIRFFSVFNDVCTHLLV